MRRNWLLSLALVLAVSGLFYGITAGALWAPHEVSVAELSRRIALNLLGGQDLSLPGADNSLPIRADLGRGELPFTSAALGFRLFGLSAWAGRLPLTLWSIGGLAALYLALRRLWDSRAALYAVLVLSTTPLYFLQARALLGDAVTLAAFALAWSGLSLACLADAVTSRERLGFALLGALGLYAGFWCRGPILSVAVPALAVGGSGLLRRPRERLARWVSLGASVVGLLALVLGERALTHGADTDEYSVFVGSALNRLPALPTFDVPLGELVHATYPWSAAAPLALVLLGRRGDDRTPASATVHAAALGLGLSLAASAWLSPVLGAVVLPGVCCFAALVAFALRELEAGKLGAPLLGLVVAALAVVIGFDLRVHPEKALSGFGLAGVTLPEALEASASWFWLGGAGVIAVGAALWLYEAPTPEARLPVFQRAEYGRVLGALQQVWDGNLVFALLLLEAALVGFLLLSAVSERLISLPQLEGFGSFSRKLVAAGAIAVPLAPLLVVGALLLRDASRLLFSARRFALTRAQGVLLVFAALGGAASLGFYPALARQVSPKLAFERYHSLRRGAEPLGVLGEQSGAARYQGAPAAESFDGADVAFEWLAEPAATERRFLLLRKPDLPELNAQYRALRHTNLPILDARSSEVLLASNLLRPGERNDNPLAAWLLDQLPPIQHPLHAVLGDELEVLGWSLRSRAGQLESSLTAAQPYQFAIYFRVLAPISGGVAWQTFVHLDGLQRRFNADHEPLDGKYPLRLWRANDVIVDATELRLEPNFSPGAYRLYFGLFSGERRFAVTEGPENEGRIVAGTLQVR